MDEPISGAVQALVEIVPDRTSFEADAERLHRSLPIQREIPVRERGDAIPR